MSAPIHAVQADAPAAHHHAIWACLSTINAAQEQLRRSAEKAYADAPTLAGAAYARAGAEPHGSHQHGQNGSLVTKLLSDIAFLANSKPSRHASTAAALEMRIVPDEKSAEGKRLEIVIRLAKTDIVDTADLEALQTLADTLGKFVDGPAGDQWRRDRRTHDAAQQREAGRSAYMKAEIMLTPMIIIYNADRIATLISQRIDDYMTCWEQMKAFGRENRDVVAGHFNPQFAELLEQQRKIFEMLGICLPGTVTWVKMVTACVQNAAMVISHAGVAKLQSYWNKMVEVGAVRFPGSPASLGDESLWDDEDDQTLSSEGIDWRPQCIVVRMLEKLARFTTLAPNIIIAFLQTTRRAQVPIRVRVETIPYCPNWDPVPASGNPSVDFSALRDILYPDLLTEPSLEVAESVWADAGRMFTFPHPETKLALYYALNSDVPPANHAFGVPDKTCLGCSRFLRSLRMQPDYGPDDEPIPTYTFVPLPCNTRALTSWRFPIPPPASEPLSVREEALRRRLQFVEQLMLTDMATGANLAVEKLIRTVAAAQGEVPRDSAEGADAGRE